MADIYLDETISDIVLKNNDLYFTSDIDFIETMRQRIRAALYTFLGEYFLDDKNNPIVGVPYLQTLLSEKLPTIEVADDVFRTALLNIKDVVDIIELSFDLDRSTRNLKVTFKVSITDNGLVIEDIIDFNLIG